MSRQKSRGFTQVELEFMHVIWKLGEATPDDLGTALSKQGRHISVGSIRNMLGIMIQKGYIIRRKKGKAFYYRAKIHKDQARKTMIQDLLVDAFDGSESLVVAALLDRSDIREEELEEIKRIIADSGRKER